MNNSNPFAPTRTPADPDAAVVPAANQETGSRGFEIFHNTFRGLLAFLCFGLTPVFVLPNIKNIFEEFGIELPVIGQLILQFSDLACIAPVVFLPVSFVLFAVLECGIFLLPSSKSKILINATYWLIVVLMVGSACFAFVNIFNAIISGVTATIATTT